MNLVLKLIHQKQWLTNICTSAEVTEQFSHTESYGTPEKSWHNDDSGTPAQPIPPIHVLWVANDDANPSPVTVLQSLEAAVPEESPNVNASRVQCQWTEDAVHLSIPVAPAPIPTQVNFNYDYDGTDSDGEIEPFFNAVEDENELDSDDDIGWDDLPDNEPPI